MAATFRETGAIQNPAYRPTGKFPFVFIFSELPEIKGGMRALGKDNVCVSGQRKGLRKQTLLTIR
jgi:hypothetical protein